MNRAIEMPRFFFFLFFLNFLKGFGELDENKFSSTGSSLYEWRAAECNKYRNRFSVLSDKNEVQSRAFDWLLFLTLRNRKKDKEKGKGRALEFLIRLVGAPVFEFTTQASRIDSCSTLFMEVDCEKN